SPAQRATNSAVPDTRNAAVKRPPFAPAVTTCSVQLLEPFERALTTIGSPPCAPFSAPFTVILFLAFLKAFLVSFFLAVVRLSVDSEPVSPPVGVVKRLRQTPLPAAGVEVSA